MPADCGSICYLSGKLISAIRDRSFGSMITSDADQPHREGSCARRFVQRARRSRGDDLCDVALDGHGRIDSGPGSVLWDRRQDDIWLISIKGSIRSPQLSRYGGTDGQNADGLVKV